MPTNVNSLKTGESLRLDGQCCSKLGQGRAQVEKELAMEVSPLKKGKSPRSPCPLGDRRSAKAFLEKAGPVLNLVGHDHHRVRPWEPSGAVKRHKPEEPEHAGPVSRSEAVVGGKHQAILEGGLPFEEKVERGRERKILNLSVPWGKAGPDLRQEIRLLGAGGVFSGPRRRATPSLMVGADGELIVLSAPGGIAQYVIRLIDRLGFDQITATIGVLPQPKHESSVNGFVDLGVRTGVHL